MFFELTCQVQFTYMLVNTVNIHLLGAFIRVMDYLDLILPVHRL